eukprot:TRINITY_DN12229_c5_g2_i5.p1 TRINITY_DN12229_c5_g2~~TRINITY_DN12229_c5_g2_i5.p1  ORF type:complete len:389 (+),score=58.25 TRINITY_DN12229_c5_g2_i5:135-1301(+)
MIFPYTSRTLLSRARFVAGRWLHSACIRQTKPHLRQPSSPSLVAAVSSTGHLELHLSERVTGVMTPETITVDPLWACHQCCCPSCIQQGSGQRMQVPPDHLIPDLLKDVNQDEEFIYLHWQHNPHATVLSLAQVEQSLAQQLPHAPATPCTHLAKHDFALVAKDDYALWECLNSIAQDGACLLKSAPVIVTGCDNSSSAAMDGVVALANRISQPQPTFYGTTFDVVATDNPINIAYSNVALDLHQDLVYYESPPGLQFLHAVSFPEEVTGGESILMDAFAIAQRLREAHPDAFDTLTRMPMVFEKVEPRLVDYEMDVLRRRDDGNTLMWFTTIASCPSIWSRRRTSSLWMTMMISSMLSGRHHSKAYNPSAPWQPVGPSLTLTAALHV